MNLFTRLVWLLILFTSCKKFIQYHPDEIRPAEENLNSRNIQLINNLRVKDTFSFILISDTQRFYDELEAFTAHVNTLAGISFVLLNGDITDFGLNREYNLIAARLKKLQVPYIASIGNHDMLANGRPIFNIMFGPENFSFNYGSNKFIILNANSREVGFDGTLPDMSWLTHETLDAGNYRNIFFMSHVPPFSVDFDRNLETEYASLVSSTTNSRISMHGHEHNFSYGAHYNDGFPYLVAGTIRERNYVLITVRGKQVNIEQKYF